MAGCFRLLPSQKYKGGKPATDAFLNLIRKLGMLRHEGPVRIVVCGSAGSGKTSLIAVGGASV